MPSARLGVGLLLLAGVSSVLWLSPRDQGMGSYCTSVAARTRGQRENAWHAARALEGVTIPSGAEFSFNRTVGPWTADRGYVRAPVSYEGELLVDWGGGVCQTSTTLYNAALLAGLEVMERQRHSWAPRYVPPGRDAAVAQSSADLRLRNPYPWPVRIRTLIVGDSLSVEIRGRLPGPVAAVQVETDRVVPPGVVVRTLEGGTADGPRVRVRGRAGVEVSVYRSFLGGPRQGQRELLSQDYYPPLTRVLRARTAAE